jgi:hypothetical protein
VVTAFVMAIAGLFFGLLMPFAGALESVAIALVGGSSPLGGARFAAIRQGPWRATAVDDSGVCDCGEHFVGAPDCRAARPGLTTAGVPGGVFIISVWAGGL